MPTARTFPSSWRARRRRLVRCNHGNGPAPDHVCESAWLDGTLYQGADCLTAMFGEGALDAAAD